jgi:hypothetical protein
MRISIGYQKKFLVAFSNENLFVDTAAEGHFYGMSATEKFQHNPAAIFCVAHRYRKKIINAEGLFIVNPARVSIQDSMGCCTFQMSLVYNRVC